MQKAERIACAALILGIAAALSAIAWMLLAPRGSATHVYCGVRLVLGPWGGML